MSKALDYAINEWINAMDKGYTTYATYLFNVAANQYKYDMIVEKLPNESPPEHS